MLGNERITLGQHWSYNLRDDPKRLAFVLSRYKFAARMAGRGGTVLELGCSEGLGGVLLAEFASGYIGVDYDAEAVQAARRNWGGEKMRFVEENFLGKVYGEFHAVVSLDVVEHIEQRLEKEVFDTVRRNTRDGGICIVGTPNVSASVYASASSRANHVNLFDADRLKAALSGCFGRVFVLGMNDEIVHSGFAPMAHYLLAVGCVRRAGA